MTSAPLEYQCSIFPLLLILPQESEAACKRLSQELAASTAQAEVLGKQADEALELYNLERGDQTHDHVHHDCAI